MASQLGSCPPFPPLATDLVYIELMKTNTQLRHFSLSFDFCTEGHENVWEAMAATLAASVQPEDSIVSASYTGLALSNWPMLTIVFASLECAKAFTYVYLGFTLDSPDVNTDDDVLDYVSYGKFVE